jgi:hypothetical protein
MKRIVFIVLAGLIAILSSCEKDEQNSSDYRVKQIITYVEGIEDEKYVFEYTGDKLSNIAGYEKDDTSDWVEVRKVEITYEGNKAIRISSYKQTDTWEIIGRIELTFENNQLVEETEYDYYQDVWQPFETFVYHYSGNTLISWENIDYYEQDSWISKKGEYNYENNKLTTYYEYEIDAYDRDHVLLLENKQVYNYTGNLVSNFINYYLDVDSIWNRNFKWEYAYSGNKLSELSKIWEDEDINDWEASPGLILRFKYNNIGNLSEYSYIYNSYDLEIKDVYEYESGKGNAEFFWYNQAKWIYGEPILNKSTNSNQSDYVPYYERMMIP